MCLQPALCPQARYPMVPETFPDKASAQMHENYRSQFWNYYSHSSLFRPLSRLRLSIRITIIIVIFLRNQTGCKRLYANDALIEIDLRNGCLCERNQHWALALCTQFNQVATAKIKYRTHHPMRVTILV